LNGSVSPSGSLRVAEQVGELAERAAEDRSSADLGAPAALYHRLAEVRREQGVSMRSMSRRLGVDPQQLRQQESPDFDLRLSELHRWQAALEVPLVDLLVEPQDDFACPVQQRAQLLKIMKTALAISELATQPRVSRLAQMLREQLVTLMPELEQVSAWPNYGGRRPADEMGKTLEHPVSTRDLVSDGGFE
jgi:transcriptional regulator with XRE-family HTH domain